MSRIVFYLFLLLLALPAFGQSASRIFHRAISTDPPATSCDEDKEEGRLWQDTDEDTDGAICFCTGSGGWKCAGSGGGGDITDVWACTSGNCNAITGASGDTLDAGSADYIRPAVRSATLPATCTEGDIYHDTDSGGVEWYSCVATNVWRKFAATNYISEYHPDNYPPAGDQLMADEFINNTPSLTWTDRNLDSAVTGQTQDSFYITEAGTTDQWHGATTTAPADNGADFFMVAKVNISAFNASTRGCGISLIHGGSAASPSDINSMSFESNGAGVVTARHNSHTDYDFSGESTIGTSTINGDTNSSLANLTFYVALQWVDSTEDITGWWSRNGRTWQGANTDGNTSGHPAASGIFVRDDTSCTIEYVRWLDTDIDAISARFLLIGGRGEG